MKLRRLVVLALCFSACAFQQNRPTFESVSDVRAEIARWEAVSKRKGNQAEAHKNLSMLYSHPSLATPDYRRSLEELESYVALDPSGAEEPDVKRWLSVLRTLREAQRAVDRQAQESVALKGENRELQKNLAQENAALKGENRELQKNLADARREAKEAREAIEKLKEIDLQQERMRKTR